MARRAVPLLRRSSRVAVRRDPPRVARDRRGGAGDRGTYACPGAPRRPARPRPGRRARAVRRPAAHRPRPGLVAGIGERVGAAGDPAGLLPLGRGPRCEPAGRDRARGHALGGAAGPRDGRGAPGGHRPRPRHGRRDASSRAGLAGMGLQAARTRALRPPRDRARARAARRRRRRRVRRGARRGQPRRRDVVVGGRPRRGKPALSRGARPAPARGGGSRAQPHLDAHGRPGDASGAPREPARRTGGRAARGCTRACPDRRGDRPDVRGVTARAGRRHGRRRRRSCSTSFGPGSCRSFGGTPSSCAASHTGFSTKRRCRR